MRLKVFATAFPRHRANDPAGQTKRAAIERASTLDRELQLRIIGRALTHQGPQDTQELVHQDTQCLHLGQWVFLSCLQMQVITGKSLVYLH